MAARLAREFQDGWIVNLGTGMPTLCSSAVPADRFVVFHAENGVIGYGPLAKTQEEASPYLTNDPRSPPRNCSHRAQTRQSNHRQNPHHPRLPDR
jgi:acyl CoA:acetate/3-ketoacid CoA transferase beta subunit